MKDWIATIVRFHPTANLQMLEEALASLSNQTHKKTQIIVLIQNGSDELAQKIISLLAKNNSLETNDGLPIPYDDKIDTEISFKTWKAHQHRVYTLGFDDSCDHRATLLNVGIQVASTEFIAFLDYDDILYPDAYSTLIKSIRNSQSIVSVGGCSKVVTKEVRNADGTITQKTIEKRPLQNYSILNSKIDLAINNFVAIHSYIIDLTKVNPSEIKITKCTNGRFEDYELLLRLLPLGDFDFSQVHQLICDYRIRESGNNTVYIFNTNASNKELWNNARLQIQSLKSELEMKVGIADLSNKLESLQAANGIMHSRSFKLFLKLHNLANRFNFIKRTVRSFVR